MSASAHLIVGLGNPGKEYAFTRHNAGFMALDAIAAHHKAESWKRKFDGLLAQAALNGAACWLLKPQTFMNVSGPSVRAAMEFHKMKTAQVIVIHDDLDLPPGQVKVKQGGSSAGHNGLKSIDAHIGADYWRVRIGIGRPMEKGDAVTNYVLSDFAKADQKWLELLLGNIADHIKLLLAGETAEFLEHISA